MVFGEPRYVYICIYMYLCIGIRLLWVKVKNAAARLWSRYQTVKVSMSKVSNATARLARTCIPLPVTVHLGTHFQSSIQTYWGDLAVVKVCACQTCLFE